MRIQTLPIFLLVFFVFIFNSTSEAQQTDSLRFTSDLAHFGELSEWKNALSNVKIVALGENTHGLGDVFRIKSSLVKFLHEELDFDIILFESGFGDAALAWEHSDAISIDELTKRTSSNFFY